VCLPKPLVRDSDGTVRCNVIWELPPAGAAAIGVPTECAGPGTWLQPLEPSSATRSEGERRKCVVQQLPVTTKAAPEGHGWYYDDFSEDLQRLCEGHKQRVSFTESAKPGNGVVDADAKPIPRAEACAVSLQDGSQDRSMFCHPDLNVCVRACQASAECPPAWVCDMRNESMARASGQGFCVNPTCGSPE
jgi:hypothetical protein